MGTHYNIEHSLRENFLLWINLEESCSFTIFYFPHYFSETFSFWYLLSHFPMLNHLLYNHKQLARMHMQINVHALSRSQTVQNSLVSGDFRETIGAIAIAAREQNLFAQFATEVSCGNAKSLRIICFSHCRELWVGLVESRPPLPLPYTGHWLSNTLCCVVWPTIQFPCSQSPVKLKGYVKRAPTFKVACGKYSFSHSVIEVRDVLLSEFSNVTPSLRE